MVISPLWEPKKTGTTEPPMKTLNCQPISHWTSVPQSENERSPTTTTMYDGETHTPSGRKALRDILECPLTQTLEKQYGERWERMSKYSKLTFRAILSLYIFWSHWFAAALPQDLMAEAIEQTNSDLHLDDPEVYSAIAACTELPLYQLEELLVILGEQIREECWSSNGQAPRVEQP
ncbi:MAG: hypothetical protein SW833_00855 [Cyanobacteriota bacterium]|nr:hypothetical protein [Cyanobacteriota bacterium]